MMHVETPPDIDRETEHGFSTTIESSMPLTRVCGRLVKLKLHSLF